MESTDATIDYEKACSRRKHNFQLYLNRSRTLPNSSFEKPKVSIMLCLPHHSQPSTAVLDPAIKETSENGNQKMRSVPNNLPFRYPEVEDLQSRRVIQTRPFNHIGLDIFGPLHLNGNRDASETTAKTYGSIFTCATTRLIHLELLLDASTSSLLNALRRFIARQGYPTSITCDNAPSFKLGQDILAQAMQ